MGMNLHLQFLNDADEVVGGVELMQVPTEVTWWCVGYTDREGNKVEDFVEPTTDEIKARYFEYLDTIYDPVQFAYLKEKVDEALIENAKSRAEFFWL